MKTYTRQEAKKWFQQVADLVGQAFRKQCPNFVALAGKWPHDDLVPGLSDMDFRIICDGRTKVDDWLHIDRVMGRTMAKIARDNPQWNRINEHTAGTAMTIPEMMDERFYNPEYSVLDIWFGPRDWLDKLKASVSNRPFGYFDEHTHLMKFLTYYSPYIHGIDPPVNLGSFEPKYAMHSRCWHYFAPPMYSAASLLARRNFAGKRDALNWLCDNGHIAEQTHAVLEKVNAHYETPELTDSDSLRTFEEFLYTAFEQLYPRVCESIQFLQVDLSQDRSQIKKQLNACRSQPSQMLMDKLRWARTRAGRCYFYLNTPEHYSVSHQLKIELIWLRRVTGPMFEIIRNSLSNPDLTPSQCLQHLDIAVSPTNRKAIEYMFTIPSEASDEKSMRRLYEKVIEVYPRYYRLLELAVGKVIEKDSHTT